MVQVYLPSPPTVLECKPKLWGYLSLRLGGGSVLTLFPPRRCRLGTTGSWTSMWWSVESHGWCGLICGGNVVFSLVAGPVRALFCSNEWSLFNDGLAPSSMCYMGYDSLFSNNESTVVTRNNEFCEVWSFMVDLLPSLLGVSYFCTQRASTA